MKSLFLKSALLLLIIYTPMAYAATGDSGGLWLGKSKVEITPPAGTPLAGYGRRHGKPSSGIHDPLYARALALTHDNQTFIFVSADLVLIDKKLEEEVLRKVQEKAPLRDDQILLFATHTHSGSGALSGRFWQRFIMGKKQKTVFQKITSDIAAVILQAYQERIPVSAEFGKTQIDSLVENRMDEKKTGPYFLKTLRFKSDSGQTAGTLIFMAAHPTLLPASNFLFSSDFPGALTKILDDASPGSTSLFVNGAAGDLRPKAGDFEDRFQKINAYASSLAQEIEQISYQPVSLEGPWKSEILKKKLPSVKIQTGILGIPSLLGGRIFPRHSTFHVLRMGKFLFLSFPGELGSEIGQSLESQAQAIFFEPLIVGYAHDYIGYVIPKHDYLDRHQYESRASFYGADMDFWVQSTLRKMMFDLLSPGEEALLQKPGTLNYKQGLPVLRLRGDAYHVGFEEGRLLHKEIRNGVEEIFAYFRKEVPLPGVNRLLITALADHAWKQLSPYLSYEEYLQIKGIADGSGVPLKKIEQIHALPEIYPALCANSAAWGTATAEGRMIAIRNLDWNRKMGIHRHAAVKWISIPGQKSYANIGYTGFAGVLSGLNEKGISVGQIGASSTDETMKGVPMPFVLRRILAQTESLPEIETLFRETSLTRGYNYVFSDALHQNAMVLETTAHHLAVFFDNDPKEKKVSYSLSLKNVVFRGDPALDPVIRNLQTASGGNPKKDGIETPVGNAYEIRYKKQGALIEQNYGKLTPEIAQQIARAIAPGSNIQSVVYAYPKFWVANAQDNRRAAETDYVEFDLTELSQDS